MRGKGKERDLLRKINRYQFLHLLFRRFAQKLLSSFLPEILLIVFFVVSLSLSFTPTINPNQSEKRIILYFIDFDYDYDYDLEIFKVRK